MALRVTATFVRRLNRTFSSTFLKQQKYSTAAFSQDNEEYTDIVISGGGMVGAAMACLLAQDDVLKDKRIILLESAKEGGEYVLPEKYSNRTCALSPATVRMLSRIGAWQEIESMRCHPVLRMQVWESCADSMITFNQQDMTESLAHIVENDVILAGIMRALNAIKDRVEVRYNTRATSFSLPGGEDSVDIKLPFVGMKLSDGTSLKTKLLIGADGMNSAVRKSAKFHTIRREYGQSAVVATLTLGDTMSNDTAWQRFLPTGPIAMLPVSDTQSNLIWSTTNENAKHLQQIPPDSFVDAVNDAFWHEREKNEVAGKILDGFKSLVQNVFPESTPSRQLPPTVIDVQEGSRASFPLTLIHSSQYVRPRLALVGDAAHRLHPLAGQGVNLGFGDVECLIQELSKAVRNGSDVGALTHLLKYETERQRHNIPVMFTIDGLQRLYCTEFTPVVVARSVGLHAVNSIPFIKKMIINRASV